MVIRPYYGRDPSERRSVTEEVFSEGPCEWSPSGFLADINDAIARIPPEFRDEAVVDLEGGYDESTSLTIKYTRPETDEEVAKRVAEARRYARGKVENELRVYEELKRKYG